MTYFHGDEAKKKIKMADSKKTAFLSGTPNFLGPSYFEAALVGSRWHWNCFQSEIRWLRQMFPEVVYGCLIDKTLTKQGFVRQSETSFIKSSLLWVMGI